MPKESQLRKISVPFPEEPGVVFMTPEQWALFLEKLGESLAFFLCEQAEAYAEDYPKRWAKYRCHYRTLLRWHQKKLSDGYDWFKHPVHGSNYYRTWVIEKLASQGVRR
jgi:hypothetical protein